jgi:hypothetical protein
VAPGMAAVGDPDDVELRTVAVKAYGVSVQVPADWEPVAQGEDSLVFGFKIPSDDPMLLAAIKCEIGAAPQDLDEYRTRIDRRAEREKRPGVSLATNELRRDDAGAQLVTLWNYEPPGRQTVHDLELRLVAHHQLYTFTLRAPDPLFATLRPRFEQLVAAATFSAPDTGLEVTKDGLCVQKKFRFGLRLPADWRPSFPLSRESLFWATGRPKGIWNDNLLVIASPAKPIDIEALGEQMPAQLKREDPNCTVKSCQRVRQGAIGDALETVVETQRGPFRITVLERRYMGRRYNYEIKFTVESATFEASAEALRKSADSFVEFIAPEDVKGGAT